MAKFTSEEKGGVNIITCPPSIEPDADLDAQIKTWLLLNAEAHILDFKSVVVFHEKAYRPFTLFHQSLKSVSKKLFVMNASPQIALQMKQDGLNSVFTAIKSPSEALAKVRPPTQKAVLDVQFINPFVTATQSVLETQASTSTKPGKPYVKKGEELPMEIAGVINVTNPGFHGNISLCFRAQVFLKIYENMVGEKHEAISPEIEDAAGELLNIIFGQAKTILNDTLGQKLEKALPTILSGDKLKLRHNTGPVVVLPFESAAGAFHIEVALEYEAAQKNNAA